jgi:hypothetical protein
MAAEGKGLESTAGSESREAATLSANSPMQCGVNEQSGGGGDGIRLFDRE